MNSSIRPLLNSFRSYSTSSSSYIYTPPTIFAPATGRGKQAISILRISGPDVLLVWDKMTLPPVSKNRRSQDSLTANGKGKGKMVEGIKGVPKERKALLRKIINPLTKEVLDEAIVLYFPSKSSLTSQPTLELHTHGSPALLRLLLELLPTLSESFRLAEPGEFTRLAYEAGKMDLTEVEGLKDLVNSDTETQRKLAARQAGGQVKKIYDEMRHSIIEITSLVEALIDFGEDAEIDSSVFLSAQTKAKILSTLISKKLNDNRRGEIIRSGLEVCIIGEPNAGKSSLLNWLAQRSASIVTPIAGTTRDIIEINLDFFGYSILIADTAGLRTNSIAYTSNSDSNLKYNGSVESTADKIDEVELIGIERAQEKAVQADLKLCILSLPSLFPSTKLSSSSTSSFQPFIDPLTLSLIDSNTIIILNKLDLFPQFENAHAIALEQYLKKEGKEWLGSNSTASKGFWKISLNEKGNVLDGLENLTEGLKDVLKDRFDLSDDMDNTPIITQARHRKHLEECLDSLNAFTRMDSTEIVYAAEELRYALLSLGRITGAVDVEEVLGEIFSGFCVGK